MGPLDLVSPAGATSQAASIEVEDCHVAKNDTSTAKPRSVAPQLTDDESAERVAQAARMAARPEPDIAAESSALRTRPVGTDSLEAPQTIEAELSAATGPVRSAQEADAAVLPLDLVSQAVSSCKYYSHRRSAEG